MKRVILLTLTALLLVSSMTACGSKKNSDSGKTEAYSRVLYADDDDESTEEESEEVELETEHESEAEISESEESEESIEESSEEQAEESEESDPEDKKESSKASSSKKSSPTSSKTSSAPKTSSKPAESLYSIVSDSSDDDTETETDTWYDNTDSDDTDTETGSFGYDDLAALVNGRRINLGDDFSLVNDILGDYSNVSEEENSGNLSEILRVYTFNGITVSTFSDEEGSYEKVYKLEITSDSYESEKGARLGMSEEEIIKIYGAFSLISGSEYKYVLDDKSVTFVIEGDSVTKIIYSWNR